MVVVGRALLGSVAVHAALALLLRPWRGAGERPRAEPERVAMEVSFAEVPPERTRMDPPRTDPSRTDPSPTPMPHPAPSRMPLPPPHRAPMPHPVPSRRPHPAPPPLPSPAAAPAANAAPSGAGMLSLRPARRLEASSPPAPPHLPGAVDAARGIFSPSAGPAGPQLVDTPPPSPRPAGDDVTSDWVPDGHGGFEVTRTGFVALVDRDGRVRFRDRSSVDPHLGIPCVDCLRRKLGKTLVTWARDPYEYTRHLDDHLTGPAVAGQPQAMTFGLTRPDLPGEPEDFGFSIPFLTGRFDGTDAAMRAHGQDPYAYEKQRFLDESEAERDKMAAHRAGRARLESVAALHGRLDALWRRADLPAVERRRLLFALWDECAEHGEPALVHAGAEARAAIVGFVRAHLPRGHAEAYDDAELDALNRARSSSAEFRPYDGD